LAFAAIGPKLAALPSLGGRHSAPVDGSEIGLLGLAAVLSTVGQHLAG
jgi:hypothetical protein